jgi:hypothetical protein
MKKYIVIILMVSFISCKKDNNYAGKSSPFYVGELVKLNGFNPRTSFVPYNCCNCPCKIDSAYTEGTAKEWYYNIVDLNDTTLTNVAASLLKKY